MNCIIITGVNGEIGLSIAKEFKDLGYRVIGLDIISNNVGNNVDCFIDVDLNQLCIDEVYRKNSFKRIRECINGHKLIGLINNAALQIVKPFKKLTIEDMQKTLNVNLLSAYLLSHDLYEDLAKSFGGIVNISSIHSKLTKRGFLAYSVTKAALDGLTRALSVEIGESVRVNSIAPAAINTKMLLDGFDGNTEILKQLEKCHPTKSIGEPQNVAKVASMILSNSNQFLNGATIEIDGGISNLLHDPE